jgi:hypothetical protein
MEEGGYSVEVPAMAALAWHGIQPVHEKMERKKLLR